VITAADLSDERAIVLGPSTQLLSSPLPYADRVRTTEMLSQPLKILASESLRWGKARLPDVGEIWWPMVDSEDADEDARVLNTAEIISSEQLFARKIFDMAASPTDPTVQFASAKGVFRTVDGKKWKKLDLFEDRNYPIAISGTGAVFIGPYVSDNHGENFQQWIRWDSLVATLRRKVGRPPEQLQIREIRSEDPTGRRVVLKLFVGDSKLVRLSTNDRGQTWRSL
jgi:hypothetical protein